MATILVKNSLNNSLAVKMDVNIHQFCVNVDAANPAWMLGVATTVPSASGLAIAPKYINLAEEFNNIDSAIAEGVAKIASEIDWGDLLEDKEAPYILSNIPESGDTASIESNVYINIKDDMPSAGIDLTDLNVRIDNGTSAFDITDECIVEGDPFCYKIKWSPPVRNYCTYDGR